MPGLSPRRLWSFDSLRDHLGSRENNFTVIRFLLASMVLYGHSFALAQKKSSSFLVADIYGEGQNIGYVAVNCFFFISGLLITQSYCRRQNFGDFFWARVQRIFPGNTVCLLLCVFVLGPVFTNRTLLDYFQTRLTYEHLFSNFFLWKLNWLLPGVFLENRLTAINGSLWTLPTELNCYLMVGFIGLLAGFRNWVTANLTLLTLLAIGFFIPKAIPLVGGLNKLHPIVFFAIGSLCFFNARHIYLNPLVLVGLIAACVFLFQSPYYNHLFSGVACYAILILAYRTPFLSWNKWGDFSYGMYIYAFPIQQSWVDLHPKWTGYRVAQAAFLTTIPFAVASWFLIEKKAIAWRRNKTGSAVKQPVAAID